jgi:hypothetical protein
MTMTSDEQVGREVGRRLTALAGQVPVVPVPSWDEVRRSLRRATRRRRARRAAGAGGAVLGVVALLGGVQLGVVPYPSYLPAVQLAGGDPSVLAEGPTRGSLAGDAAWLESLRERVAAARWDEPDGESWSVRDPDDVTVLFAGDVLGRRLAAIEAPYRWGAIEARQQVWFEGAEGAAAGEMEEGANGDAAPVAANSVSSDEHVEVGVVVLAAEGRDVVLFGTPTLAADGSIERPIERPTTVEPGVYVWTPADPAQAGPVTVDAAGMPEPLTFMVGERPIEGRDVARTGRGADLPDELVGSAVSELASRSGVGLDRGGAELVWSGGSTETTAWLAIRAPSGAVLIGVAHDDPSDEWSGLVLDRFEVLPADAAVVAAWQLSGEEAVGADGSRQVPGPTLALLGPADAAAAELLDAAGTALRQVRLVDGGGQAAADGADAVRFLAANGTVLARTDVLGWGPEALEDLTYRQ